MSPIEQLGRGGRAAVVYGRRFRRDLKRATARYRRRQARRLLDEAPRRAYRGWAD